MIPTVAKTATNTSSNGVIQRPITKKIREIDENVDFKPVFFTGAASG